MKKPKVQVKNNTPAEPLPEQEQPITDLQPQEQEQPALEEPKQRPHHPNMTVQLAVAGRTLFNTQREQFEKGIVRVRGRIKVGPYEFIPGKPHAVFYDDSIKEGIAKGLLINLGVKPR